ncbi:MAG TPA: hypothetical protein VD769_07880 [Gaiellaceae bacterium]|nr:hypothetical protein [Gaiellaceae bacterium]
MALSAGDAAEIVGRLDASGVWYCLEGGWGVDALLEEQTREHGDLDVGVRADDAGRVCAVLSEFEANRDEWPVRLLLKDARGRRVDCHPLTFDERGDGRQAGPDGESYRWPREHLGVRGRIGGRDVRCISAELQLRWHEHEDFDDVDWHDVHALCDRFGLAPGRGQTDRPGFVAPKRLGRAP